VPLTHTRLPPRESEHGALLDKAALDCPVVERVEEAADEGGRTALVQAAAARCARRGTRARARAAAGGLRGRGRDRDEATRGLEDVHEGLGGGSTAAEERRRAVEADEKAPVPDVVGGDLHALRDAEDVGDVGAADADAPAVLELDPAEDVALGRSHRAAIEASRKRGTSPAAAGLMKTRARGARLWPVCSSLTAAGLR
jgi:hypothetical protein